jgi:hypothetical protein
MIAHQLTRVLCLCTGELGWQIHRWIIAPSPAWMHSFGMPQSNCVPPHKLTNASKHGIFAKYRRKERYQTF